MVALAFSMRVKYNGLWYSYDGMERPKLNKLEDKEINFIGRRDLRNIRPWHKF